MFTRFPVICLMNSSLLFKKHVEGWLLRRHFNLTSKVRKGVYLFGRGSGQQATIDDDEYAWRHRCTHVRTHWWWVKVPLLPYVVLDDEHIEDYNVWRKDSNFKTRFIWWSRRGYGGRPKGWITLVRSGRHRCRWKSWSHNSGCFF